MIQNIFVSRELLKSISLLIFKSFVFVSLQFAFVQQSSFRVSRFAYTTSRCQQKRVMETIVQTILYACRKISDKIKIVCQSQNE